MPLKKNSKESRSFELQRDQANSEERTVEIAFSSEEEYKRWWGIEILGHSRGEIRLERLQNRAPLLADHNTKDQIGVVEDVRLDSDGVARAKVRFSRSARGEEIFQDVIDGIRSKISVGYIIHDYKSVESRDGEEVFRVTDWEPYEISVVSVPADDTVGVGRELETQKNTKEEQEMPQEKQQPEQTQKKSAPDVDVKAVAAEARKQETQRIQEISSIAESFGKRELAGDAIESGMSVNQFREKILDTLKPGQPVDTKAGFIGLDEKEVQEYSLLRALNALANPNDRRAQDAAGYEFEVSLEAQKRSGVQAQGILVPFDVLGRDMTVVAGSGSNTVATDLLANNFINLLRNRSAVLQSATVLTGLTGNISIPRQLTSSAIQNLSENEAMGTSDIEFGNLDLAPRRAGGTVPYSKQLLAQSSLDIERLIQTDLLTQIALKIDWNALNGDGTGNMPTGIRNTTGVGLVELGADGAAPNWKNFVDLETEISIDNADVDNMLYLLNAKGRGHVKTTPKEAGQAIYIADGSMINGYNYRVSNQVPANLTKGTGTGLSNITFGNFSDLIVAFWGGIDLVVDPYSRKKEGMVEITADQFYDVGVRRAESFAIIEDAVL